MADTDSELGMIQGRGRRVGLIVRHLLVHEHAIGCSALVHEQLSSLVIDFF